MERSRGALLYRAQGVRTHIVGLHDTGFNLIDNSGGGGGVGGAGEGGRNWHQFERHRSVLFSFRSGQASPLTDPVVGEGGWGGGGEACRTAAIFPDCLQETAPALAETYFEDGFGKDIVSRHENPVTNYQLTTEVILHQCGMVSRW